MNPAMAGTFTLVRSPSGNLGSYRGEATAPKVGKILGPNLVMVVGDDSIELQKVDDISKIRTTVLSGVLFNAQLRHIEHDPRFNSYCYFNSGDKLSELLGEDANDSDLIVTIEGRRLSGRITYVDRHAVRITDSGVEQQIATQQIETIVSSRVYRVSGLTFVLPTVNINSPSGFQAKIFRFELDPTLDEFMTASGKKKLDAHLTATGYTKKQKMMILGASAFLTAVAIAVPVALAVPLVGRHGSLVKENHDEQLLLDH